ncbi:bifunctional transcriptional activator/DNA repair enzyme AdaA [Polycladomyces subterraneus]|uniref:Bifunctional transcriptional activator/DNA repair enzyme AdaA n=1 Tax=Polycladomyces subterraneus TaxID=1016997 RepID=A0ABT8IIJ7_9BACL|nr:bifunctional transcriptional activator/DNA repair enzyme AdaA [Polycladomyces subterraneus]MDN4592611.1 bifunctional transcriptional activator/DNA repair enzyme AdaA [Polycladomyces subterraneus]
MHDEQWKAIVNCDPSYDGEFYYGVSTTGIFCRPSCKSKTPKRENVRIFPSIDEAVKAKFRPCKRCRPDQERRPDEDLAHQTARSIEQHYTVALTLETIAKGVHVSPYHLHHVFKRIMNMTPVDYLLAKRLEEAKRWLSESNRSVTEIAVSVGFTNIGHFSTMFHKKTGMSPTMYRSSHFKQISNDEAMMDGRNDVLGSMSI